MAVTGKSFAPISLAAGRDFDHIDLKEASAQTFTIGAPVIVSAGYIQEMATNGTSLKGFAQTAGDDSASDGLAKTKFIEARPARRFQATVSDTSAAQTLIGKEVWLGKASSSWYLGTATASSASYIGKIEGFAPGFGVGDSMPEVIFTVDAANCANNT